MKLSEIIRYFEKLFEKKRKNPIELYKDSNLDSSLKPITVNSKNTPIQGASADMTKKALVLMRCYIKDFEVPVKLVMTVHDQIDTICKDEYVDWWSKKMKELMETAALEIVTNGLLKAEVTVSNCWTK